MLIEDRSFAVVAVLTLALDIGANTAIFSVVNGTLIRPLPYPNASRLVMVWESKQPDGEKQNVTSPATFLNWQADNTVFEQIASSTTATSILTGGDTPEQIASAAVTPNLFRNARCERGDGESLRAVPGWESGSGPRRPAQLRIVAASLRLESQYSRKQNHRRRQAIHSRRSDAERFRVLHQATSCFAKETRNVDTIDIEPKDHARQGRYLQALGLLRPGVSLTQAQNSMTALAAQLEVQDPAEHEELGRQPRPLAHRAVGDIEPRAAPPFAAVGLVTLLIACANVARTLSLARATPRKHEIAISYGAGRINLESRAPIFSTEKLPASLPLWVASRASDLGWATLNLLRVLAPANLSTARVSASRRALLASPLSSLS